MTFKYIDLEECRPGENCRYREISMHQTYRGIYYVSLDEIERVLTIEPREHLREAFKEIRVIRGYGPEFDKILTSIIRNPKILEEIARKIEFDEVLRRRPSLLSATIFSDNDEERGYQD